MYSIEFIESARKDFVSLSKDDQDRVISVLERIRLRPKSFAIRLSGAKAYKVRVGRLRVLLDILDSSLQVIVLKIGNRENVYLP